MTEFFYNNASSGYTQFEFNYNFYPWVFFKKNVNPCSRSCFANKLTEELKKLIEIYH